MYAIYKFPYDTPLRYLPLVYMLPHDLLMRCPIMPDILAFYESEEGQREFAEWKKLREIERQEAKVE